MTMTSFLWVLGFFLVGALNVVFSVWVTCRLPVWRQNPTAAFDFADMGGILIVVFFFLCCTGISFPFMLYTFIEMNWKRRPRPLRKFLIWLWIKLQP